LSNLVLAALAAVVGAGWVAALWYLRITAHPAVLSWERLARMRGLSVKRPLGERVSARLPLLRRLQAETDIGRLLTIAGQSQSPSAWLLRTGALSGTTLAALLLLDELTLLANGRLAFPLGLSLLAAAAVAALAYVRVRNRARWRQQTLDRAVADSLPHVAVMTYHHRVPVSEALLIFSRCQRNPALHQLLADPAWEEMSLPSGLPGEVAEGGRLESTATGYERVGRALGVPMLLALGSAVRRVNERGLSSQEVLTGLARATYSERLVQARVAAAQAKTLIVVPMGLMIVPVLILIGAPLIASLAGVFGR
jgi:hypothetical protein